jgi:hypothetical protein
MKEARKRNMCEAIIYGRSEEMEKVFFFKNNTLTGYASE